MSAPETMAYMSQGLRLNLCAWGDPAAPPLVLLHGVRDHARSWDLIAAAFADRHYVLAPDLRGHGDSEWAKGGFYPTEGYVFDLAELGERLGRFALIGHSLGGNIGLRYAALYPEKVRRIVAIEGLSHSPKLIAEQRAIPVESAAEATGSPASARSLAGRRAATPRSPRRASGSPREHPRLDPRLRGASRRATACATTATAR